MDNLRTHGSPPYRIAVIHGGPGAPGSVAPVARELAANWGILEPLQTAVSLDGQITELRTVLEANADLPVTLIGWSWGAMLSYMVAAHYPALVKKLILVSSGVYDDQIAARITPIRLSRLNPADKCELDSLLVILNDPASQDKNAALARLGQLFEQKTDSYDPQPLDQESLPVQMGTHQRAWDDMQRFRASGDLIRLGEQITCPVVAIHGDYDPHPVEGVRDCLAPVIKDFRFIQLPHCGHTPWIERDARDDFFAILRRELV